MSICAGAPAAEAAEVRPADVRTVGVRAPAVEAPAPPAPTDQAPVPPEPVPAARAEGDGPAVFDKADPPPARAEVPVAQEGERDHDRGTLSLIWENDVFAGTDRNYTNGLRMSYVSAPVDGLGDWHRGIAGFVLGAEGVDEVRYGLAIGQSIFTPEDIEARQPLPDQHPYAGWLYGEYSIFAQRADRLRLAALQVGMVGPSAGAETVQNDVHDLIGVAEANGWDNQLHDELAFSVMFEQRDRAWLTRRVLGPELDLTPHYGFSLGTLQTQAKAGLTVRFGEDLRNDYGPPRIRPAVGGSGFFEAVDGFGWYLFGAVEGRAVARNIFLDGNTFQDSASVTKRPLVADFQGGLVLTFGATQLSYTIVTRTKEFETQSEPQIFGSVSLAVKF
ncbi:lipid A deacylase LpxR family protein [Marinibaculum pumilum]|uniref:lipid A deacylase LpxR family protein n=1 Tax=Marinibaculum pumilum TaxID=1766165 RepID=UPI0036D36861